LDLGAELLLGKKIISRPGAGGDKHAPNIQISVKKNPILKILSTTILCGCIASTRGILHQSAEKQKEKPAVSPSVLSISTDDR